MWSTVPIYPNGGDRDKEGQGSRKGFCWVQRSHSVPFSYFCCLPFLHPAKLMLLFRLWSVSKDWSKRYSVSWERRYLLESDCRVPYLWMEMRLNWKTRSEILLSQILEQVGSGSVSGLHRFGPEPETKLQTPLKQVWSQTRSGSEPSLLMSCFVISRDYFQ